MPQKTPPLASAADTERDALELRTRKLQVRAALRAKHAERSARAASCASMVGILPKPSDQCRTLVIGNAYSGKAALANDA